MPINYDKLTLDIIEAKKVAKSAAGAHDARMDAENRMRDGGTCNLDGMFLDVSSGSTINRVTPKLKAALAAANEGRECSYNGYGYRKGFWLGGCWGQGDRNVAGVKAGVEYLKSQGWPVSYWAQMD